MRLVIKFGSGILTREDGAALDDTQFEALVAAVAGLRKVGHACIVVSSGAVAAGMMSFGMRTRPVDTPSLQALAAVGQSRLMHFYETYFRVHGINVAQLLLTHGNLETDDHQQRVRNTLERLLEFPDVIPIINENDSVAVEELKFGDNDTLSAHVAAFAGADMLILLTSVDGLRDLSDPDESKIIEEVADIDAVLHLASGERGAFSVGGMASKLRAVKAAVGAGVQTAIANGRQPAQLAAIVAGGGRCTRFLPAAR